MMQMRIDERTLRVPYVSDESIERDAEALLAQYAHAKELVVKAPIPIEEIIEKHLKLRVDFDDLHRLLGVPRGAVAIEPDIFGAIWLETGEIVIDESLDPEGTPVHRGPLQVHPCARGRWALGDCTGIWCRQIAVKSRCSGTCDGRQLFAHRAKQRSGWSCRPTFTRHVC
jgi:hypothetical protein